jgi:hypothetical protein
MPVRVSSKRHRLTRSASSVVAAMFRISRSRCSNRSNGDA